jgi:alpha-tubulin suppressor-like RCC1 family protein
MSRAFFLALAAGTVLLAVAFAPAASRSDTRSLSDDPALPSHTVSAGGYHTCALRTDGTLACWGYNAYGQATPPAGTFSQVSAGYYHTCGVRTDGTLACWGNNGSWQASPPPAPSARSARAMISPAG